MKKYGLLLLAIMIALVSCSGRLDYGYNEKVTSLFYSCKEKLDDEHGKLMDGGFDKDTSDHQSFEMALKEAKRLGAYCKEIREEAETVTHSEAANAFHAAVINYMSQIETAYTPLLVQYVTQQDSSDRKATRLQLATRKAELGALEDKCLEVQLQFLDKAGIKINEASSKQ
ncbi:hypothetical protein [Taibaiella chishuiensis]|uniref:Lipoprotein n=1 Tax=Taibaiella chishuiensis TaxID=1434707 RepID=A0A2P8D344_9BACT|nr:hypothetical protein [Taibaiella chishuiensis]PSK91625.1 hypothetical protein B0I18_105210 [Taibaiella chishuiensis]